MSDSTQKSQSVLENMAHKPAKMFETMLMGITNLLIETGDNYSTDLQWFREAYPNLTGSPCIRKILASADNLNVKPEQVTAKNLLSAGTESSLPPEEFSLSLQSTEARLTAAIEKASPAVVNIRGQRRDLLRRAISWGLGELNNSLGTGFIIDKRGFVLTTGGVVSESTNFKVALANGQQFNASVAGIDLKTDLAILRIDSKTVDLPVAALGTAKNLATGDWVAAISNPFGLSPVATAGEVLANSENKNATVNWLIQTDLLYQGADGAPLIDIEGRIAGIISRSKSPKGITCALPLESTQAIIRQTIPLGISELDSEERPEVRSRTIPYAPQESTSEAPLFKKAGIKTWLSKNVKQTAEKYTVVLNNPKSTESCLGCILNREGYMVASERVLGFSSATAMLSSGLRAAIRVIGHDPVNGFVLLKLDSPVDASPEFRDQEGLKCGTLVATLLADGVSRADVSYGIISALGNVTGFGIYDNYILTDTPANQSNLFCPLFDFKGRLIGINIGASSEGRTLVKAIPIDDVLRSADQLRNSGRIKPNWLGISVEATDKSLEEFEIYGKKNLVVKEVSADAARDGIRPKDCITHVNGERVHDIMKLYCIVNRAAVHDRVQLKLLRSGKKLTVSVPVLQISD